MNKTNENNIQAYKLLGGKWLTHACSGVSCPTHCNPTDYILAGSSVHGIFRQECWSGLSFPYLGDLPEPGIEPGSPVFPALQADSLLSEPPGEPYKAVILQLKKKKSTKKKE